MLRQPAVSAGARIHAWFICLQSISLSHAGFHECYTSKAKCSSIIKTYQDLRAQETLHFDVISYLCNCDHASTYHANLGLTFDMNSGYIPGNITAQLNCEVASQRIACGSSIFTSSN